MLSVSRVEKHQDKALENVSKATPYRKSDPGPSQRVSGPQALDKLHKCTTGVYRPSKEGNGLNVQVTISSHMTDSKVIDTHEILQIVTLKLFNIRLLCYVLLKSDRWTKQLQRQTLFESAFQYF